MQQTHNYHYQWQQYCIWLFYSYFGQAEPLFWIKMNLLKKFIEQRVEVDRNKIRWNSPTIRPHFDTSRKSLYLWPQRFILSGRLNVTWIFVIKCYFCAQHNYHSDWPLFCPFWQYVKMFFFIALLSWQSTFDYYFTIVFFYAKLQLFIKNA